MPFKTVQVFDNAIDARLFSSKLESEGIACFIENESTMTLDPLLNYAVGGVPVLVEEEDYKAAVQLMDAVAKSPLVGEDGKEVVCPRCKSTNIQTGFSSVDSAQSVMGLILGLMLFVVPFLNRDKYRCVNCNCIFKRKKE